MLSDEEILRLYKDPNFVASFTGVRNFRNFLFTDLGENVSEKRLYGILKKDPNYIMHMKPVRKFPTRKYDIKSFGELVQADLADMFEYEGFKYFLVVVDAFSKHIYAEPLRDKTAASVGKALELVFKKFETPITKLETDQGKEFIGNKSLFKQHNIIFKTKHLANKASFAEGAIRLIKRKLYMMMRSELSKNWLKYLAITVESLNSRHIKSLGGVQPKEINSFIDDVKIRHAQEQNCILPFEEPSFREQNQNQADYLKDPKSTFKIGDYVYLDFKRSAFDKSYDTQVILTKIDAGSLQLKSWIILDCRKNTSYPTLTFQFQIFLVYIFLTCSCSIKNKSYAPHIFESRNI